MVVSAGSQTNCTDYDYEGLANINATDMAICLNELNTIVCLEDVDANVTADCISSFYQAIAAVSDPCETPCNNVSSIDCHNCYTGVYIMAGAAAAPPAGNGACAPDLPAIASANLPAIIECGADRPDAAKTCFRDHVHMSSGCRACFRDGLTNVTTECAGLCTGDDESTLTCLSCRKYGSLGTVAFCNCNYPQSGSAHILTLLPLLGLIAFALLV